MKKMYPSIDLFKFLFAIAVVSIHTTLFLDLSEDISWLMHRSQIWLFHFSSLLLVIYCIAGVKGKRTMKDSR